MQQSALFHSLLWVLHYEMYGLGTLFGVKKIH